MLPRHTELHLVAENPGQAEHRSVVERMVEAVAGWKIGPISNGIHAIPAELDPQYCAHSAAE